MTDVFSPTYVPPVDYVPAVVAVDAHGSGGSGGGGVFVLSAANQNNIVPNQLPQQNMELPELGDAYLLDLSPEAFSILNNPENRMKPFERAKIANDSKPGTDSHAA